MTGRGFYAIITSIMDGKTSGFSIEGILLLLGLEKRTGELVMESGNNIGSMLFHEGKILQAFSPYTRALGDLLVDDGVLTDTELIEVLKLQKSEPDRPVGSMLMRAGKVGFEIVEMMVHEQIRQAVSVFSKWNEICFSFIDKDIQPFDTIHLTVHEFVNPETLESALDSLKRMITLKSEQAPAQPSQQ